MTRVIVVLLLLLAAYELRGWTAPCSSPLPYRTGDVDSRFGLSEAAFLDVLREAEAIWEGPTGRDLLQYAQDADLPVNLVYDNRQQVAQENLRRKDSIERTSGSAEELKAEHEAASARYEAAKKKYQAAQAAHDTRVAAHNRNVESWNARGGAPPAQLAAVRREEAELTSSANALEKTRLGINSLADRANTLSARYNDLVEELKAGVDAINSTAGREFKQGRFIQDSKGIRIDVFEYVSREDLVHVLAHELGHALGVGHNDNPESIMYGLNSSRTSVLTGEDLAGLRETCGF